MNIYVAGKFEEAPEVRKLQDALRGLGHKITHDWTDKDATNLKGRERADYLLRCAWDDLQGVQVAEALIVLYHPQGCGSLVEVGIALGRGVPVIVVGARTPSWEMRHPYPIFYHLPQVIHVDSAEEAAALIARAEEL